MWRWNVCYYMAYNNELEYCLAPDLRRLVAAHPCTGSTVFHFLIATRIGTRHVRLTGCLARDVWDDDHYLVESTSEPVHLADPETLHNFIQNAQHADPAQYYAIVYSGGGCATYLHVEDPQSEWDALTPQWASLNREEQLSLARPYFLGIGSLRAVLERQKCDLLVFDCCIMASLESVYELRNVTSYIVACQEWQGVAGLGSDKVIGYFADTQSTPYNVAIRLSDAYIKRTNDPSQLTLTDCVTTQRSCSVIQTSNLELLIRVIERLPTAQITLARQDPVWISPLEEDQCAEADVYGVASKIRHTHPRLWREFQHAFHEVVIANFTNFAVQRAKRSRHGLSFKVTPYIDGWVGVVLYTELQLPYRLAGGLLTPYENYSD